MSKRALIHIGTSGWYYRHWKGPFYPEGLPDERLPEHYIKHFQTVESNNSFYQLPEKDIFMQWHIDVSRLGGFLEALRGPGSIRRTVIAGCSGYSGRTNLPPIAGSS